MIAMAAALVVTAMAPPPEPSRDDLVRRTLHELHRESFDAALATSAELRRRWPQDPAGYLGAANVYQTMMRDYRVRVFEALFESSLAEALAVAERAVLDHPSSES